MGIIKNQEGQIRSGWKIVIALFYIFISITGLLVFTSVALLLLRVPLEQRVSIQQNYLFNGVIGQLAVLIGTYWAFKAVSKRQFKDLGLHISGNSLSQMSFGLVFGAMSISLVYLILLLTGHISIASSGINLSADLLTGLLIFILVGFSEEIFFRGYIMDALDQMKKPS